MDLVLTLSPIAVLISLFVFTLVLKKGFIKSIKYAVGVQLIIIMLMTLLVLITSAEEINSPGWISLFLVAVVIICLLGCIIGLVIGCIYKHSTNPTPNKSVLFAQKRLGRPDGRHKPQRYTRRACH